MEIEDKLEKVDSESFKAVISEWSNSDLLEEASAYETSEIFSKYGKDLQAIAKIPDNCPLFKGIYKEIKDHKIYSSKGYFIDHAVNHHPELEQKDFLDLVDTAEQANKFFYDKQADSVILTRPNNGKTDALVVYQKNNQIILEQTFFKSSRLPKRWKEISPTDGLPIIRQQDKQVSRSGSVRNISALGDNSNISQNPKKSTSENLKSHLEKDEKLLYQSAKVNVNGVVRECKSGLVQGFKNAVIKVDELKKENFMLKNENENLRQIIQNNLDNGIERQ